MGWEAWNPVDAPLWNAIEGDDPDEIRRLLASGVEPAYHRDDGWSPLHHAVDAESDFNSQVGTPLDLRLITPLLEGGAAVNPLYYATETSAPETPLDIATSYGNEIAAEPIRRAGGRSAKGMPPRAVPRAIPASGDDASRPA